MTVNSQVMYDNFTYDHNKLYGEINKTNTQISSGKKIQHSYEDGAVFTQSLRLDSEVKNLDEVQDRTTQAKIVADSADSVMSEFDTTLRTFKTKLIQASNQTLNSDNYQALATELEAEKDHMINLANSSINGIYLFSGTDTNIAPIDQNGNYHGNDKSLETVISKNVKAPYSINGQELFLGDYDTKKTISTNVKLLNQNTNDPITSTDKISDLIADPTNNKINLFISGKQSDGTAFKKKVSFDTDSTMDDMLSSIGKAFGNTDTTKLVDVKLDKNGNITVNDLKSGKSSLSLDLVAVQGGNSDTETTLTDVTYDNIIHFTKSGFEKLNSNDEDLQIDTFKFKKDGGTLSSNTPLLANGEFATNKTLLKDIANGSMNGKTFKLDIVNINGDSKKVDIDLKNNSTFTIDGNEYNIYNADGSQTQADQMTQGQLNNIISMVVSDKLPASNDKAGYDDAVKESRKYVEVSLDSGNKLQIKDKTSSLSKIEFSMYDADANDFSKTDTPTISFMSNDLVTTQKTQTDFFKDLDEIIQNVRAGKVNIGDDSTNPRGIGIENAISNIDKLSSHFNNNQAKLGTYSKSLEEENAKAMTMQTNVMTLKSEVEDIDLSETIVKLNQLTLNYQAMLSTVSKVNSLSLLNYLK